MACFRCLDVCPDDAIEMVQRDDPFEIGTDPEAAAQAALLSLCRTAGLDPDGRMNVQGVRDDLAFFARQGCISGEVADVGQVVDESFIDYAVGVLGPYPRQ